MKFGIVGVIAFIIDWGILNILVGAFHMHNVLAATISFIISLIFNYVASMKMVFKHREDMARWMEIVIFVVGAVIGLFMNDAIIWISTYGMNHDAYVTLVPFLRGSDEHKSKPTQHSVKELQGMGVNPNIVVLRCDEPLEEAGEPPDSRRAGGQVGEQLLAQARRVVAGTYAQGLAEVTPK